MKNDNKKIETLDNIREISLSLGIIFSILGIIMSIIVITLSFITGQSKILGIISLCSLSATLAVNVENKKRNKNQD